MAEKGHPDADAPVMDPHVPGVEPVKAGDKMPKAEPLHRIAKKKEGEVFDPNAARREAEGRGPGLQDSEAINPAHWVVFDEDEAIEAEVVRLQRQIDALKAQQKAVKEGNA